LLCAQVRRLRPAHFYRGPLPACHMHMRLWDAAWQAWLTSTNNPPGFRSCPTACCVLQLSLHKNGFGCKLCSFDCILYSFGCIAAIAVEC